ncbi:MAG: glutamate-5-semialdehyde dehydrogenase [Rhodospirillaceae bacterium]
MNGGGQTSNDGASQTIDEIMEDVGRCAVTAGRVLAIAPTDQKNSALRAAAGALRKNSQQLLSQNDLDMEGARSKGLKNAIIDRLELTEARIEGMAGGLEDIAELKDPVGEIIDAFQRPSGLKIERVRTPLGVIGVIYESRPNVTADAGALCLKAGNACILRGGSESYYSSAAILSCLHDGLAVSGLPISCIQMVPTTDRAAVGKLLTMTDFVDVIVPRGGQSLTERVMRESRIPTFQHLVGLCHTYIHADADVVKARRIVLNAKMRRVGICGATETILVDRLIVPNLLALMVEDLVEAGCEVRGDESVQSVNSLVKGAKDSDWSTEYLDAIVSIKVVDNVEEAIEHINKYGSEHTDAIVTEDSDVAEAFMNGLSSAIVMHNASTQFADGGEFGMGAEIGIATGKMHARGPVGVEQLTTFKYKVRGNGTTRP